jgi:hypothetical protein
MVPAYKCGAYVVLWENNETAAARDLFRNNILYWHRFWEECLLHYRLFSFKCTEGKLKPRAAIWVSE